MTKPLCIDCKHMKSDQRCEKSEDINLVNGDKIFLSCWIFRLYEIPQHCGPSGKFFEPKS